MLAKQPRRNLLFESAIAELQRNGAILQPIDYVWLYDSAQEVTGSDVPAFIETPVPVGNTTLYPLTIGAWLWWNNYGLKWFSDTNDAQIIAMAYAMAHSKDQRAFDRMTNRTICAARLVAWQISLSTSCTVAQLEWAIDKVLGQFDYVEINTPNERRVAVASGADWGDIIARLCATYHQPPEYFLWQISEKAATEMLDKAPRPFDGSTNDAHQSRAMGAFFEIKRHLAQNRKAA